MKLSLNPPAISYFILKYAGKEMQMDPFREG